MLIVGNMIFDMRGYVTYTSTQQCSRKVV